MLCAAEPVACWSRLPNDAGGATASSARMPAWVWTATAASPPDSTRSTDGSPGRASSRAFGGLGGADEVDVVRRLAAPAQAPGDLDPRPGHRRAQLLGQRLGDGEGAAERDAPLVRIGLGRPGEPLGDARARAGPDAGDAAQPVLGERRRPGRRGRARRARPRAPRRAWDRCRRCGRRPPGPRGRGPGSSGAPRSRRSRRARRSWPGGSRRCPGGPWPAPGGRAAPPTRWWPAPAPRHAGTPAPGGARRPRSRAGRRAAGGARRSRRWSEAPRSRREV